MSRKFHKKSNLITFLKGLYEIFSLLDLKKKNLLCAELVKS